MKYLKSWIEDYWKTEKSGDEIAKILSALGSEAESISLAPAVDENVVAAKVLEVKAHPNADRLKIAKVTIGTEEIEVVCGAPNVAEGQCVAYARPGAKIRGGKVEKANIRSVESPGMLLSERELGIGDDHTGIKVLDENLNLGSPILKHLRGEIIFEADITPNRGDLASHFGLARDLYAAGVGAGEKALALPPIKLNESEEKVEDELSVEIKTKNCPLYLARKVSGVKIGPSPDWLVKRLEAVGVSSINNVVDVTNYIMLDLGHPLHAFDMGKIASSRHSRESGNLDSQSGLHPVENDKKSIIIRELDKNEEVVTLDGEARELIEGMMVIADKERSVAVAGVMGLKNSEIDNETTDVVIEAAVFDRKSIRKTAKLLGISTEASYRFERGVDDVGVEYALDKAAKMIGEVAGGKILKGIVKDGQASSPSLQEIGYEKISRLIGVEYPKEKIDQILESLGFKVENGQATVPSWRHDIEFWQDLAEEVARIEGIDKIKAEKLPEAEIKSGESDWRKKEAIKDCLVSLGLTEALNYTFLSEADINAARLKTDDLLEVANPVQVENRYLRNSLVPGLLKSISRNPSFDIVEFFEIGNVFSAKNGEKTHIAIATAGKGARDAKKIANELSEKFDVKEDVWSIYQIDRDELSRFKIRKPSVSIAEADLTKILQDLGHPVLDTGSRKEWTPHQVRGDDVDYRPISSFPSANRDLAFVVDAKISLLEIRNLILEISPLAVLVEPFDEFKDSRFGKGKKSVAFHIYLQSQDKTLSDGEVEEKINKIVKALKSKFSAELRS